MTPGASPSTHRVVVMGSGFGGLFATRALRRVMLGDVTSIDLDERTVRVNTTDADRELPYDSLVVAVGAGQSYSGHGEYERRAPSFIGRGRSERTAPFASRSLIAAHCAVRQQTNDALDIRTEELTLDLSQQTRRPS